MGQCDLLRLAGPLSCVHAPRLPGMFLWRKSGPDPDRWPAVVFTRNSDWWECEGGAVSLVVGLIDGSVGHWGLPSRPGPNRTSAQTCPKPRSHGRVECVDHLHRKSTVVTGFSAVESALIAG